MEYLEFTTKSATPTLNSATRYRFDNNKCYQILPKNKHSVIKWYHQGDYHMIFRIAYFDTDDMTPPKSKQEFLYGLANMHTMYYLDTEHVFACAIELREEGDDVQCVGIPFAEDEGNEEWVIAETDCVGVFKINGDVLEQQYASYHDACRAGLTLWKHGNLNQVEYVFENQNI